MRIGIDLDNTICNTSEIIFEYANKFAKEKSVTYEEVFKNSDLREEFFLTYTNDIFLNVSIKDNVKEVLNRLKDQGHELYVITARSNDFLSTKIDVLEPTKEWLKKHSIVIDKIIINSYGLEKAEACLANKIELMIDDDLNNCQIISNVGIKCLLFDDQSRYNESNRVSNWLEVERYIEGELK